MLSKKKLKFEAYHRQEEGAACSTPRQELKDHCWPKRRLFNAAIVQAMPCRRGIGKTAARCNNASRHYRLEW